MSKNDVFLTKHGHTQAIRFFVLVYALTTTGGQYST